ncbi:synaptosomal-associated protein 29-like [Paramacrobiotus metropolitanus]|uniref:synaptosomal-associated protein 29-like n=1 Tax=Paramacrobiotus metropolitanus TaxID=2943436 RepID=UPI002445A3F6|nr:synaptosomal-associated protein 29-like [Paramacrobiotus metropolitanus]
MAKENNAAGKSQPKQNSKTNFFDDNQDDDFSSYFRSNKKASSNPFEDEDSPDVAPRRKPDQGGAPYGDAHEKLLSPRELYQQEVQTIQDRTLHMTAKSLLVIDESEAVGTAAAQELLAQREQLERTNRNLDEMNTTLDQSQKHLNNIRSVFGGIKNWWTSKPAEPAKTTVSSSSSSLRSVVESSSAQAASEPGKPRSSSADIPPQPSRNTPQSAYSASKQFDKALDSNLDQMSLGLSRLKGLAEGLGTEIEQQNKLLDDMSTKTDRVSSKMGDQQKSIDKILGKKK